MESRQSVLMEVTRLSEAAMKAAVEGQWNVVDACYRAREAVLPDAHLLPEEADRLLLIDRDIRSRISTAHAALESLLHESVAIRQRLKGLRQGIGAASSDSGMILLEA